MDNEHVKVKLPKVTLHKDRQNLVKNNVVSLILIIKYTRT